MATSTRRIAVSLLLSIFVTTVVTVTAHSKGGDNADDTADLFRELEYPELQVSPLASERLQLEASQERFQRWVRHYDIQISALATFGAATMAEESRSMTVSEKKNFDDATQLARLVGTSWLITTGLMSAIYTPYRIGWNHVRRLPDKDKRDKIARERFSEEYLYAPAKVSERLKWISFVTNGVASLYLLSATEGESAIFSGVSLILSLTPFLFKPDWEEVADRHREYKKKIYGPVSSAFLVDEGRRFAPGLLWKYSF